MPGDRRFLSHPSEGLCSIVRFGAPRPPRGRLHIGKRIEVWVVVGRRNLEYIGACRGSIEASQVRLPQPRRRPIYHRSRGSRDLPPENEWVFIVRRSPKPEGPNRRRSVFTSDIAPQHDRISHRGSSRQNTPANERSYGYRVSRISRRAIGCRPIGCPRSTIPNFAKACSASVSKHRPKLHRDRHIDRHRRKSSRVRSHAKASRRRTNDELHTRYPIGKNDDKARSAGCYGAANGNGKFAIYSSDVLGERRHRSRSHVASERSRAKLQPSRACYAVVCIAARSSR